MRAEVFSKEWDGERQGGTERDRDREGQRGTERRGTERNRGGQRGTKGKRQKR